MPGDCVRACVASILERPLLEVPHFVAGEVLDDNGRKTNWLHGINLWLEREGYTIRLESHSYYKDVDCQIAWRKDRDAAGIRHTYRDSLWLYDPRDEAPWHPGFWIAGVISENFAGCTHAIVMEGSEVVHDPSPRPRRTPYKFVAEDIFYTPDPSKCRIQKVAAAA
jgi:hypothetical protein